MPSGAIDDCGSSPTVRANSLGFRPDTGRSSSVTRPMRSTPPSISKPRRCVPYPTVTLSPMRSMPGSEMEEVPMWQPDPTEAPSSRR